MEDMTNMRDWLSSVETSQLLANALSFQFIVSTGTIKIYW